MHFFTTVYIIGTYSMSLPSATPSCSLFQRHGLFPILCQLVFALWALERRRSYPLSQWNKGNNSLQSSIRLACWGLVDSFILLFLCTRKRIYVSTINLLTHVSLGIFFLLLRCMSDLNSLISMYVVQFLLVKNLLPVHAWRCT